MYRIIELLQKIASFKLFIPSSYQALSNLKIEQLVSNRLNGEKRE